eukprot:CAMPEP_0177789954 /NCGR_PEP_ID=MMETSP0491_2-20121128/23064_1 /TAXON_ID=63592 /ORGANISM="Tetraselmis chuii, Strain PLY429" /LENGTH=78 /DNA_ID=CAMNT_0019311931 /DNA_START=293 /DNA_END=529 /DNA_ORIENTATION=-
MQLLHILRRLLYLLAFSRGTLQLLTRQKRSRAEEKSKPATGVVATCLPQAACRIKVACSPTGTAAEASLRGSGRKKRS